MKGIMIGPSKSSSKFNILGLLLLMVSVQGYHNQYFHYAPYRLVMPNTSPVCHGNLPCYNIMLTLIGDGPVVFNNPTEEKSLLDHFENFNYDRDATIAEGRKAILFFKEKYGIDFTHLSDDALLIGKSMKNEGITFLPFVTDPVLHYRLYSASNNDKSQVFNRPISEVGWKLFFENEFQARGTYSGLIPHEAIILYSTMVIKPCQDIASVPCKNVLNPWNPRAPILLKAKTISYFVETSDPVRTWIIDYGFEHSVWGQGIGTGTFVQRSSTSAAGNLRHVVTFPSTR